jgi:hypothetical protein
MPLNLPRRRLAKLQKLSIPLTRWSRRWLRGRVCQSNLHRSTWAALCEFSRAAFQYSKKSPRHPHRSSESILAAEAELQTPVISPRLRRFGSYQVKFSVFDCRLESTINFMKSRSPRWLGYPCLRPALRFDWNHSRLPDRIRKCGVQRGDTGKASSRRSGSDRIADLEILRHIKYWR